MRKEVTSLLMLLISVAMTAQESNWTLTPKAGMTVATLAGEDAEYCSNAIGWTAGVDLGRRLSERVELTLGVGFTKNVVKDDIGTSIVSTRVFDGVTGACPFVIQSSRNQIRLFFKRMAFENLDYLLFRTNFAPCLYTKRLICLI